VINHLEKQKNLSFSTIELKNYIDLQLEDSKSWDLKKQTDVSKVRLKWGSDFNKSIPTI
jgi:hypothetical protein